MNDRFEDLRTFVAVVQARSFKGAADRLGLVKSAVSRRVRDLEDRLGAQLLSRTTRSVHLTDIGSDLYWRSVSILASLAEAEQLASSSTTEPMGRLKVSAPSAFASLKLAPVLGEFVARHPRVCLDVRCNDGEVDLIADGFDMAIVAGTLRDSNLVTRRLCTARNYLVASPSYLDTNGRPTVTADLVGHRRIMHAQPTLDAAWMFAGGAGSAMSVAVMFDSDEAIRAAAIAGAGLALLPAFVIRCDIEQRRLEIVMDEPSLGVTPLSIVFPSTPTMSAKVRALIDFLVGAIPNETLDALTG